MPLDKAEEQNKSDLMERAKKELEDWYKQHEEQVAKTRQANRYVSVPILPCLTHHHCLPYASLKCLRSASLGSGS